MKITSLFSLLFVLVSGLCRAEEQSLHPFDEWKNTLAADLLKEGFSQPFVLELIGSLTYLPKVIELDRRQPDGSMSHETYLSKVIPEWKVQKGRAAFKDNLPLLTQAEQTSGVDARFLVALWGKETNYGTVTGNFHIPSALATLAFEGRRAEFFRRELFSAAKIISDGHIGLYDMKGSWAGAMGHCQFMPSSFLAYAIDANADGKIDIWNDKQDIFASMGNYLAKSGWAGDQIWGRQVKFLEPFNRYPIGKEHKRSLADWQSMGVRRSDMTDLPKVDIDAYLIAPGGEKGRIYLVYHNFDVLMKWNRSHYFATGVGYLADRIGYPKID